MKVCVALVCVFVFGELSLKGQFCVDIFLKNENILAGPHFLRHLPRAVQGSN